MGEFTTIKISKDTMKNLIKVKGYFELTYGETYSRDKVVDILTTDKLKDIYGKKL